MCGSRTSLLFLQRNTNSHREPTHSPHVIRFNLRSRWRCALARSLCQRRNRSRFSFNRNAHDRAAVGYSHRGDGADFAEAQTNRDAFLADLALSTGANIVGHTLTERYANSDAVTSTFNLWRELQLTVNLATVPLKKAAHTIVAPSLNFVNGTSLNLGHADVTAYLNNFLDTGGVVSISDGEKMTDTSPVAKSRIKQVGSGQRYSG